MGPTTIAASEPHVPLAPVLLTLLLCCSLPLLFIFPLFISAEIRPATFTDRMAVEWLVVGHVLLTLMVVISILCGRWPIFRGTIVEKIHHFINIGAYDYFLRFAVTVFGSRARDVILSVEHYCCDQPNPALQILYLAIIGVICVLLAKSSFVYIPGHYVSGVHRYTSLLAVGVGVLLFLLTSFSDPGTIKAENVSEYLSAYPYDNIIYTEKECSTCKIPRPARSKHCHICDRCVARFDHHCGWMNNCIGEKNTRYFLAFLLWHSFLCLYGAVGLGLILAGELKEKRVIYILTVYYRIENSFYRLSPHVMQWLLASYNTQVLLMVFLAFVSFLLAGFFGYNAHLCLTNTTTNETFKWQEYISWKRKLNEAKASSAALKASICAMNGEGKPPESKWKVFFRESPLKNVVVKDNIYDQGVFRNLLEIMCPLSGRASFMPKKSK